VETLSALSAGSRRPAIHRRARRDLELAQPEPPREMFSQEYLVVWQKDRPQWMERQDEVALVVAASEDLPYATN
jgi:hypothetical protein